MPADATLQEQSSPAPASAPAIETKPDAAAEPKPEIAEPKEVAQPKPDPSEEAREAAVTEFGRKLVATIREVAKEAREASSPPPPPPPPALAPVPPAPSTVAPPAPAPAVTVATTQPVPHETSAPQTQAAAPQPVKMGSSTPGIPGMHSEAEADAKSVKESPQVHLGHVLAAQGLQIATRRPRWSNTTMLTRSPRNAVVVIRFNRDGVVKYADFATVGHRRYSTGYEDVDEPLLNAIYSWTAKGEALNKLSPDDPTATVKIVLTIVLG
jgi:hypothetical protein